MINIKNLKRLGEIAENPASSDEADAYFSKFLDEVKDEDQLYSEACFYRAFVRFRSGRFNDALQDIDKAIEILERDGKRCPLYHVLRADINAGLGRICDWARESVIAKIDETRNEVNQLYGDLTKKTERVGARS